MKIDAGGALNQRKRAGADHRAAQDCELAGAGDEMDLQVVGIDHVAGEMAMKPKLAAAIITADGEPSRPSVKVHRIAAPT